MAIERKESPGEALRACLLRLDPAARARLQKLASVLETDVKGAVGQAVTVLELLVDASRLGCEKVIFDREDGSFEGSLAHALTGKIRLIEEVDDGD